MRVEAGAAWPDGAARAGAALWERVVTAKGATALGNRGRSGAPQSGARRYFFPSGRAPLNLCSPDPMNFFGGLDTCALAAS